MSIASCPRPISIITSTFKNTSSSHLKISSFSSNDDANPCSMCKTICSFTSIHCNPSSSHAHRSTFTRDIDLSALVSHKSCDKLLTFLFTGDEMMSQMALVNGSMFFENISQVPVKLIHLIWRRERNRCSILLLKSIDQSSYSHVRSIWERNSSVRRVTSYWSRVQATRMCDKMHESNADGKV